MPFIITSPEVALKKPEIMSARVLLPEPVLPTIATFSPFLIEKYTFLSTSS